MPDPGLHRDVGDTFGEPTSPPEPVAATNGCYEESMDELYQQLKEMQAAIDGLADRHGGASSLAAACVQPHTSIAEPTRNAGITPELPMLPIGGECH